MPSILTERSGAQLLPRPEQSFRGAMDDRATVSAWAAHLAADADLRRTSAPYAALAAELIVNPV